ncbi:DnaJ sub C member 12 [Dipsacomyces acuminosporus]|nr:DnaJ sub C member 12 [Dipsacomyces acuminosporus]
MDQINTEYRLLARQYHPDRSADPAEDRSAWERVRQAYETLSDPYRRAQYDRYRVSKLPISFEQWLKTTQAQAMHWSFDYQRTIENKTANKVSAQSRWWASREASENAITKKGGRDVYEMFRNYEI